MKKVLKLLILFTCNQVQSFDMNNPVKLDKVNPIHVQTRSHETVPEPHPEYSTFWYWISNPDGPIRPESNALSKSDLSYVIKPWLSHAISSEPIKIDNVNARYMKIPVKEKFTEPLQEPVKNTDPFMIDTDPFNIDTELSNMNPDLISSGNISDPVISNDTVKFHKDLFRTKREIKTAGQYDGFTQKTLVSSAYIPKKVHIFRKKIPFQDVAKEITSLQYNLKMLNPSQQNVQVTKIKGQTREFLMTNFARTPSQNALKCAEFDGSIATWELLNTERIPISSQIAVKDHFSVSNGVINCEIYGIPRRDTNCIETIKLTARTMGLTFSNKSTPEIFSEITSSYSSAILSIVIDETSVKLIENPSTITLCTTKLKSNAQTADAFTSIIQTKFFSHLSQIYSTILEAFSTTLHNQQHMFSLMQDSRSFSSGARKPLADKCKAAKKLYPTSMPPVAQAVFSPAQAFLDTIMENTLRSTTAFVALKNELNTLCEDQSSEPVVDQIYQALMNMNMNIQGYFTTYKSHLLQTSKITVPIPFPILLSQTTKAADVHQLFYGILKSSLATSDVSFLLTLIENEKTSTLVWLKEILSPDLVLPEQINLIQKKDNPKDLPQKTYKQHNEFQTNSDRNARTDVKIYYSPISASADLPQADDPGVTVKPTVLIPVQAPSTEQPPDAESFDFLPVSEISLNRRKRHWLAEAFSDATGLATQEDVDKLERNEEKLAAMEEKTQVEIKTILTKTNTIIDSLTEQASKMSKLYSDETALKDALRLVMKDEQDTIIRLAHINASMEILSDISLEYSAFGYMLMLVPQMLQEIEESLLALTTQSLMPSILPASNLKHVIPMYTRASILAASVYAEMTPTDAFIITKVPEFHPPFEIYSLKTIPFAKQNQTSLYMKLNLKNKFVAVNSISETFLFNPNHCPTKKGIIICQPSAVEIHKVPTSCEELLVTSPKDNIELCTNATSFTTISVQSHIYLSKT